MFRLTVSGVLLAVAVSIAACGTSASSNSEGGDGALGKVAFIKRADEICKGMDKAQAAAMDAFIAKRDGARLTRAENEQMVAEIALPPVSAEVEQLEALPAPEGDEEEIQAFLDEVRDAVEVGEDDPGTLVDSALGPFAAAGKLGREYGFKACAFPH